MLHVFRESFGRYVTIAILALIAVTFIFWGIDFSITQLSFAAKVNGEAIPITEYDRQVQSQQNQIQQQLRIELTDDLRREIRRSVLDDMVMREVLRQRAEEAGLRVSDARVVESVQSDPNFQAGGRFSRDVYVSLLAQQGLTPAGWEARQRDLMTIVEWQNGLVSSSFITPAELRRNIELLYERREIAYAEFDADAFLEQVEIDDAAVAEYYEANSDSFMTEESVDIEFVELDLASIADTVEISEQELRDYYDDEIERFAAGEERHVRHILIEPEGDDDQAAEAEAETVMDRLAAGEDFAELAMEVSDDVGTRNLGGDLGWMSRGVFPAPFEDTLFSMSVGDVEGPVKTDYGYHILKLEDVRSSAPQPFDVVREQLRDDLASDRAYSIFYDRANDLANEAYEARDDLSRVAEDFGLELETIEGLTRSGNTDRFADPTPVIAAAFDDEAIVTSENSDLIDLGDDGVAVIRVTAHYLPETKPLDEVAEEIRSVLALRAAEDLSSEAATAYRDALDADEADAGDEGDEDEDAEVADAANEADETNEAEESDESDESDDLLGRAERLAAEHGAVWHAPIWIERDSTDAPAAVVSLVFAQPVRADGEPAILRSAVGNGDEAVVFFMSDEPGVPDDIPMDERDQGRDQLTQRAAAIEINAYAADARSEAKVRIPDEILNPEF